MNKLAIIGCGNMGSSIVEGLIRSSISTWSISVYDSQIEKGKADKYKKAGVVIENSLQAVLKDQTAIVIAVKPKDILHLVREIGLHYKNGTIISVAAGVSLNEIKLELEALKSKAEVIRVMPNLAVAVGKGVTGIYYQDNPSYQLAQSIFSLCGVTFKVNSEEQLEVVTALCGCGPGFLCYFAEALIEGAKKSGLNVDNLDKVVSMLMSGTSEVISVWDVTHEKLRKKVTTPGGSTEAGVEVFNNYNVKQAIIKAVEVAANKGKIKR